MKGLLETLNLTNSMVEIQEIFSSLDKMTSTMDKIKLLLDEKNTCNKEEMANDISTIFFDYGQFILRFISIIRSKN